MATKHLHFETLDVDCTRRFQEENSANVYEVNWFTDDGITYTITIKRIPADAAPDRISLYNLGIQGRRWTTLIEDAQPPNGFEIHGPAGNVINPAKPGDPLQFPWEIPATNSAGADWDPVDENEVRFLYFTGETCTVTVTVAATAGTGARRPGKLGDHIPFIKAPPAPPVDGHDEYPPPPEPGGEN